MVRKKVYHVFLLSARILHFLSGVFFHFIIGADNFGGTEGERYSPEEYIKNVPVEDVVDEIFDVLESFRKEGKEDIDFRDEYDYYWHILTYRNDM